MKKTFKLHGLECANCAAKMQDGISKLDGVTGATVNFITAKLVIECDGDKAEKAAESARTLIKKLEPDVVMEEL